MMAKLVEYNGMEHRNRKLVIEYHKSDKEYYSIWTAECTTGKD